MNLFAFSIIHFIAILSLAGFIAIRSNRWQRILNRIVLTGLFVAALAVFGRFLEGLAHMPTEVLPAYEPVVEDWVKLSWWSDAGLVPTFGFHPTGLVYFLAGWLLFLCQGWDLHEKPLRSRMAWIFGAILWPWLCFSLDLFGFSLIGLLLTWNFAWFDSKEERDELKGRLFAWLPLAGMVLFVSAWLAAASSVMVSLGMGTFFDLGAETMPLSRQNLAFFLGMGGWLLTSGVVSLVPSRKNRLSNLNRNLSVLLGFLAFGHLLLLFPEALRNHAPFLLGTACCIALVGTFKNMLGKTSRAVWLPFPVALALGAWSTLQMDGFVAAPLLVVSAVMTVALGSLENESGMSSRWRMFLASGLPFSPMFPGMLLVLIACVLQNDPLIWGAFGGMLVLYMTGLFQFLKRKGQGGEPDKKENPWLRGVSCVLALVLLLLFVRFLQLAAAPMAFQLFRVWPR